MVTFETKCWEKDWEILLKSNRLKKMIERNCYNFTEKVLYINNVRDIAAVSRYADKAVAKGIIDKYVFVDDHAKEALEFFGIDKKSFINEFGDGYYYSIQELVGIYLCKTEYLLHFSSDSILVDAHNWVQPAIQLMKKNPSIKLANPVWNRRHHIVKQDSFANEGSFYFGRGFSDQCYLIPVADYKKKIYNEKHIDAEAYPDYGGELFEKRVYSWLRNHDYVRGTYWHTSYKHKNFSKYPFLRKLKRVLGGY